MVHGLAQGSFELVDVLATGRHTFRSPVTRRQNANRPKKMFTRPQPPARVSRVQSDSTPLDVMVLLYTGSRSVRIRFGCGLVSGGLAIWERPPLVPSRTVELGGYFLTS